jgi:hypothetical protein
MAKHFTAVLTIHRVTETEAVTSRYGETTTPATRETSEEFKITLRGETLAALGEAIAAHTAILTKGSTT